MFCSDIKAALSESRQHDCDQPPHRFHSDETASGARCNALRVVAQSRDPEGDTLRLSRKRRRHRNRVTIGRYIYISGTSVCAAIALAQASAANMSPLNPMSAEKRMNRTTSCTGCGHALVPMLTAKGRVEPSCLWCEGLDARALDMAKWADSPFGKPERSVRQSFE
ncbi:hypothetical protein [Bradyrhizobium liaoningense]